MGVYIASTTLRNHSVGRQYMEITRYASMVGLIKDVSSGLWDGALCPIQGYCEFVVDATTSLVTEILEIHILGVAPGRNSKGLKMLHDYPLTRKITVSYFCHCNIGGLKKCACVLVNNIPSSGSVQEEINWKVKQKIGSIIKLNKRCLEGCAPPGQETAVICGLREIGVYLSPAQFQDSFRVPCVFRNTGWGIRKLTVKEVASAMDLPQGNVF